MSANTEKRGPWGNPDGPNSGSTPSVPGNKMAARPASQYIEPVTAAVRKSSSLRFLARMTGVDWEMKDARHV